MSKKDQRVLASILIVVGVVYLTANLNNFDMDRIFWPMIFVLLGVVMVFRPQLLRLDPTVKLAFVRELDMDGDWLVEDKQYVNFVGNFDLDLREADVPVGETVLRMMGFVNEVKMRVPENIGVRVVTSAFVTEAKPFDGEKTSYILNGLNYETDGYDKAERKVRLDVNCFVADVVLK